MVDLQPVKGFPRRPLVPWPGGKARSAKYIIASIPKAHDVKVEVYGGAGSVLFRSPRSPIEVYNDINDDLVNFMAVLRDREEELIRAIHWTPYARRELLLAHEPAGDPLEKARRFYVRCNMNITIASQRQGAKPAFRRQKVLSRKANGTGAMRPAAATFADTDHLWAYAERMRGVTIESMPALDLIKLYDKPATVFYADPPYLMDTRTIDYGYYTHEMGAESEHEALAERLHACKGMVLLSGYDSPLYRSLYAGWEYITWESRINGKGTKTEYLWLNPAASAALALQRARPATRLERFNSGLPITGTDDTALFYGAAA